MHYLLMIQLPGDVPRVWESMGTSAQQAVEECAAMNAQTRDGARFSVEPTPDNPVNLCNVPDGTF